MILVRFWIWSSCSSLPLDRRNFKATTPASAQWLSRFFPNYLQLPSQPHRPRALSPRRRPPFLWHRNTKIARCVRKGNWLPSPKIIAVIANFLRSCGGLAGLLFFCRVPELKSASSEFRSRLAGAASARHSAAKQGGLARRILGRRKAASGENWREPSDGLTC
jgi:hypothetical protein